MIILQFLITNSLFNHCFSHLEVRKLRFLMDCLFFPISFVFLAGGISASGGGGKTTFLTKTTVVKFISALKGTNSMEKYCLGYLNEP